MAKELILPKLGNSVESCIILEWRVAVGDLVNVGDIVCEAETDKTTVEVESEVKGTLLKLLVDEGDEADVLSVIAVVGEKGEDVSSFVSDVSEDGDDTVIEKKSEKIVAAPEIVVSTSVDGIKSSPRAKMEADKKGVDISTLAGGSGPGGRVIARDVASATAGQMPLSSVAKSQIGGMNAPLVGSGVGGRVLASDLRPAGTLASSLVIENKENREIPVKGVRKIVAQRMLASLNNSAQLTHHSGANGEKLLELRKRFKGSDNEALNSVSLNDLILFATAQSLIEFPYMNAHFLGDKIIEFGSINLGFAVDTPRGLMVPVIKNAGSMNILQISAEASVLVKACREGTIEADDLQGGTFTISNLGGFGVSAFTPVLNAPEVAILGVCAIEPKAVNGKSGVEFVQTLGLSLTYDHQGVDGAPAARFMQKLEKNIADIDLLISGLI